MPVTIEEIRAARSKMPKREVEVPDLGGSLWVRALSLKEVREIQDMQSRPNSRPVEITRKIVELATCNEDGSTFFVGEDVKLIDTLTWGTIDSLSDAAMDLSGLKPQENGAVPK